MSRKLIDNRKYEQLVSDAGAMDYDTVITTEYAYMNKYFTTSKWGRRFHELFLDYGCGSGVNSQILASLGRKVVASDISRGMVKITKQKCNVPVVVADALSLPFKNKAFSTICITGVLHHILDLNRAFDEISRCAKEVVCIEEPTTKGIPSLVWSIVSSR